MMTGYTADNVSPSGQLEPPTPKDFPHFGCNIIKLKPPTEPMLPFVMMPRPLQESNVVGKGGAAGFLGRAYDPYYALPARRRHGHGQDGPDQDRRSPTAAAMSRTRAWSGGPRSANGLRRACRELEKAVAKYELKEYYGKALNLVISGRARDAFELTREEAGNARTLRQEHLRPMLPAGPPADRSGHARGRSQLAESRQLATTTPGTFTPVLSTRMKNQSAPMLDGGLSALIADLDERGLLKETLVVAVGEFGRSPQRGVSTSGNDNNDDGRDHWPYCYTGV